MQALASRSEHWHRVRAFSVANARRNVALVYRAGLVSSRSSVAALVLKYKCEQVAMDKFGSGGLR